MFYHFRRLRLRGRWTRLYTALYYAECRRLGRNPHASAAIIDAQSVKTVEESAHINGFDAYKRVKGRKRHLLVDTLGIPLSYYVTPADMHDTQGAKRLLGGLKYYVPRLKTIWADSAYRGKELAEWCKTVGGWDLASGWTCAWNARLCGSTKQVDRRTDLRLAVSQPAPEQRLRAKSADERNAH